MKLALERKTLQNRAWRRVVSTTPQQQLVVMYIPPRAEIPLERHTGTTQFIRVESGTGNATIAGEYYRLRDGDAVIVPPNTWHVIRASPSGHGLSLYTIYSPPHHPPDLVQMVTE